MSKLSFRTGILVICVLIGSVWLIIKKTTDSTSSPNSGGGSVETRENVLESMKIESQHPAVSDFGDKSEAAILSNGNKRRPLKTPLDELFRDVLNSKDPEDRFLGMELAAACTTATDLQGVESKVSVESPVVDKRQTQAIEKLVDYCKSANSIKFLDDLRALPEPRFGFIGKYIRAWRQKENSQEHLQAHVLLLSDPNKYASSFAVWVGGYTGEVAKNEFGLNRAQLKTLQFELMERFVGDQDYLDFYRLNRCAVHSECSRPDLSAAERAQVEQALAAIADRIAQQRWGLLIPGKR